MDALTSAQPYATDDFEVGAPMVQADQVNVVEHAEDSSGRCATSRGPCCATRSANEYSRMLPLGGRDHSAKSHLGACALLGLQTVLIVVVACPYIVSRLSEKRAFQDTIEKMRISQALLLDENDHLRQDNARFIGNTRSINMTSEVLVSKVRGENTLLASDNEQLRAENLGLMFENRTLVDTLASLQSENTNLEEEIRRLRRPCPTCSCSCASCLAESNNPPAARVLLRNKSAEQSSRYHRPEHSSHKNDNSLYRSITGVLAHQLPEMYGKVPEKTIWSYWYHPENCPTASDCVLPPTVQLCVDTAKKNKGGFDHRIIHRDEVDQYVNRIELPVRWRELEPAQQKDSLMNALLARYGGVAMDITTLLLRPLDDHWNEMVKRGATFRGYMYRVNGEPWRHAEVTAVWFLMSRREGIFSTAVRNQVIGMGDRAETGAYKHKYLALGDQTILPILSMFNYSLPKCYDDPSVNVGLKSKLHMFEDQNPLMCPEHEQKPWFKGLTGPPRNDTKIILEDPRDGPQLPMAFQGMVTWNVSDTKKMSFPRTLGSPMQSEKCTSPRECWENVFMRRYNERTVGDQAPTLAFVKLFKHAYELDHKSREEILSLTDSYFFHWLKLAGVADSKKFA